MMRGWKSTRSAVIRDGGMSNETDEACTHVYSHDYTAKNIYIVCTYRNWSRAEKMNHGRKTKQKRRDKQRKRKRKRETRGKKPFLYPEMQNKYLCISVYILLCLSVSIQ